MFRLETSTSIGSAPASSIVLKKMGAILPPRHKPPPRLFGTCGISSPINHRTEFVADLRDEPVPTTSPTYASGKPFCCRASICLIGPTTPGWSGSIPSRAFFSIASACSGISGRDHASGAGERSSVLVSPVTLKTVTVSFSASAGRFRNHSASAQDCITCFAYSLPALAFSSTS